MLRKQGRLLKGNRDAAAFGVRMSGQRRAENPGSNIADAQLVAGAGSDEKWVTQMPQGLEVVYSDPNLVGAIQPKSVNTLVIITPSNFHPETFKVAASTAKHIFDKKRLALPLDGADAAPWARKPFSVCASLEARESTAEG